MGAELGEVQEFTIEISSKYVALHVEISSGSLGGAAFDDMGRLLGVPTATIGDSGDKIGYIHPIELLPAQRLLP